MRCFFGTLWSAFVSMQVVVFLLDFYGLVVFDWPEILWPLWLLAGLFVAATLALLVLACVVLGWEGYRGQ